MFNRYFPVLWDEDPSGGEPSPEPKPEPSKEPAKDEKPPWGDDFDAEKAWKLVQNLRDDKSSLSKTNEELTGKVKGYEDATKSETDKLAERATNAEKTASSATQEAARLRVAIEKGLTVTQAKRLVGETEEELAQDADELLESFKQETPEGQEPPRRPRERLRPGAAPSAEPEENDPAKLADQVGRGW